MRIRKDRDTVGATLVGSDPILEIGHLAIVAPEGMREVLAEWGIRPDSETLAEGRDLPHRDFVPWVI